MGYFEVFKEVVSITYEGVKTVYKETNNILDEIAYEQAKKNNTSVKEEKKKIKRGLTIGSLALFGLGGLF
jgi:hypothetical protein